MHLYVINEYKQLYNILYLQNHIIKHNYQVI